MNNQMLSEKQLNFARIAIVCLDILKLPLQDTLNIFIKPKDLDTHINNCTSLCTGNTRLNPDQKRKCRNGPNGKPDYKQFDVTLCYKLIRNVCPLPEPQNKWGNKPDPTHQDISDDIERIREFRNRHFAHAECAEISDNEFKDLWKEAESIIKRCQIYTTTKNGCRQDYEKMLKEINRTKLTIEEYTSVKERSNAIYIMGEEEVCYEKTAHFEAVVNLEEDVLLQVSWERRTSYGCKEIDIDSTKYKGSNNRELFVHDLCKKDEARYRAVLSRSQNNKIYSNEVYLRVLGEKPFLEDLKVTSENNEVKIHYQFSVPVKSPNVTDIQWEKNGSSLDLKNNKYLGGSYKENFLIIKFPEEKDSGSYKCRVINAAGSVTKQTVLGIPSAIIEANKEIVFGSNHTLKGTITSCPSPVKVEWLYSVDGLTFLPIDINSTKHHGSSVDATSPKLLISDADLSHQQYYRISVKNLIGECTSNIFLQVIGNRPFITSGRSCLIGGSINLSFNINVCEESPPVESVKWTKDGKELNIEKSAGKYSGGNIDDPSLTIDSVNKYDAGIYRLKAINPVGVTTSDEIILGTPDINFISNDKTDDGGVCIRMTVKSIPVPRCIKWSIKKNNSEPFQKINVNSPEYKGTSHAFPCPVLVVKDKEILEKCSFKIEVQNAFGTGEITITDKMKSGQIHIEKMESGDVYDMKPGQILRTFYDGHGARFPFARMIAKIADKFPPDKIGMLKALIHSSFRIEEDKKAASAGEYFCILQKENILTPTDVIPMQYILIGTECVELERICIEYAKKHRAVYFVEIPADNGYQNVPFHFVIDLQSLPHFRKEDERRVRETVANIVECKIDDVGVKGYLSSSSFFLVLSFKMIYVNKLLALKQQEKDELSKLRIDFFKVGSETVYVESLKDSTKLKNKHKTKYPDQQISLEKFDEPFSNEISEEYVKIENTCVCKKRKELFDREVTRWKEDDKVFLETHNFPAMFNKVVDKPYVTFVGVPGSGKSVTARHIALKLQEEGYNILPIKDICEIETHCNPEILQVFVIDDVVGVLGLDESEFNKLCKYESIIKKPEMKETKVLMTCREVVYRNEYLTNTFLSESANVVKLHSDENLLTEEDKCDMLAMYDLDKQLLSSIDLSLTSKMFPFLCKLYKKEFRNYGASFFNIPYPCILDEMDKMKQRNEIHYASLVLMMFNDSKLSESILDDDKSSNRSSSFQGKKISVLKRCKVDRETHSFRFIDALSDMEGTYTNKFDSEYTFIHDSMFEIVACHFGRQFPELMIQYMSSDYFANYIKVDGNESENRISENEESTVRKANGLCIIISESHYQMLAERLFRDVENGEMFAFENEALKHPSVLQTFIDVIARKSYTELFSIFLSELKKGYKILNSIVRSRMKEHNETYNRTTEQVMEVSRICSDMLNSGPKRAISWVIYHGHNQILQCIIDQILTENGNVNDLFQNSYKKDVEQFRLLCLGCYSADNTTVKILLKHIDIENIIKTVPYSEFATWEMDPLTIVCKYGYDKIASELLQASANTNLFWKLRRPFVVACGNGNLNVVKALINTGANVNEIYDSKTPLTAACKAGHVNVVDELIKAGADINLADEKETPLINALHQENLQMVELLVNAGSKAIHKGEHETSLTIACLKGQLEEVKKIIQAGTDVNLRDGVMTPLVVACYMGHLSVVKEMIKAGADVNLLDGDKTPLTAALLGGHSRVVDELINAGACVNLKDKHTIPIMVPCSSGNVKLTKVLVEAGADVNIKHEGETPLTVACSAGYTSVAEELLNAAGVEVNLQGKGKTPLFIACRQKNLYLVQMILKAGADANLGNLGNGNDTPLRAACDNGDLTILEELIKAGADVNLKWS